MAREVYRDGAQALATTDTTVATMTNVVAGSYAIFAKTIVQPAGGPGWTGTCTLDAGGGGTDTAELIEAKFDNGTTMNMQVVHTFAATGSIVLRCRATQPATARVSKIAVIKVDSVTREAVTG